MTNENTPARRLDDNLPSQPLHWEDQPEAERKARIETARRLESELAAAGAAYLAHMGTGGGIAVIPNTGPAQYVVAGTMAAISKVLGEQMGSTATGEAAEPIGIVTTWNKGGSGEHNSIEPHDRYQRDERGYSLAADLPEGTKLYAAPIASQSQAAQPTKLTPERIEFLWEQSAYTAAGGRIHTEFARSIERDLAAHIAGTSQAESPNQAFDAWASLRSPLVNTSANRNVFCAGFNAGTSQATKAQAEPEGMEPVYLVWSAEKLSWIDAGLAEYEEAEKCDRRIAYEYKKGEQA